MSDPLSTAAAAVSFISVGIEVCKGLASCFRDIKAHDKDIGNLSERIDGFRITLEALKDILPKVRHLDSSASPLLQHVRTQMLSCNKGMDMLGAALKKFQSIGAASSFQEKLHNLKQRSLYPFRKEVLQELQNTVAEMQNNLNSALQVLGIYMQSQQGNVLEQLRTTSTGIISTAENIQVMLQAVDPHLQLLQNIDTEISRLPDTIETAIVSRLEYNGHRLDLLKREIKKKVPSCALQQCSELEEVRRETASIQLGMIQRPDLLRTVVEEQERLGLITAQSTKKLRKGCSCFLHTDYRRLPHRHQRSYWNNVDSQKGAWNLMLFSNSVDHHHKCPVYNETKHERMLGFNLSYCGTLLAAKVKASLSITRGGGGLAISPTLSFCPIVPTTAENFELFAHNVKHSFLVTNDELHEDFDMPVQRLQRLYSERKASPYDVDQDGNTVLHKACRMMADRYHLYRAQISNESNFTEKCFQFLQKLQDLGVPLNKANVEGRTCLSELFLEQGSVMNVTGTNRFIDLCHKLTELGAELPLRMSSIMYDDIQILDLENDCFPDLAEALQCNEISQAILARSESMLRLAIKRAPHLIDQPNLFGQTPLHLSVTWPKGMEVLLNENADVDAVDRTLRTPVIYAANYKLLEPLRLLGRANCGSRVFHRYYPRNLLDEVMMHRSKTGFQESRENQDSVQNWEAINYTISLLSERRKSLESLVVASLPQSSIRKLNMPSDKVLDHNATLAIEMLQEANIHVPNSLITAELSKTVYHSAYLNQRHARSLWQAGFRDVNQIDDSGLSPLMITRMVDWSANFETYLELAAWLVSNGASLHCLQGHTFRTGARDHDRVCVETNADSSIMAVHYIGIQLGFMFYNHLNHSWHGRDLGEGDTELLPNCTASQRLKNKKQGQSLDIQLFSHTPASQTLMRNILGDSLGDSCLCPCSSKGCLALTMIFKGLSNRFSNSSIWSTWNSTPKVRGWSIPSRHRSARLDGMLQLTFGMAELLQIGKPEMGRIRSELFRFHLFEILDLRHTCCTTGSFNRAHVIVELGDEEDRREIREEQKEQVDRLESLLVELEDKFQELGVPFVDFMEGYWHDRMKEVVAEQVPVNKDELRRIGVLMKESEDDCPLVLRPDPLEPDEASDGDTTD